jgi:uncharacterized protein YndB with AHSA1/START domain
MTARFALESRRFILASPERVFAAWTDPAQLEKWWGPVDVRCISAAIDLRIGGQYRIGNELPDRSIVWIEGAFERIERPHLLVFSWRTDPETEARELVTVRLTAQGQGTEVVVTHERIESRALRERHGAGWEGCLDGLVAHLAGP